MGVLQEVEQRLLDLRAFGFGYARQASLPALPVVASMQNEDSLLGGQSLYIAELARARVLLERSRGDQAIVCLVDEIFRGTNYEESVSAAAAVVDELAWHALEPGVLGRTNGVALLAEHGFDEGVQRRAEQVAAWLVQQRQRDAGMDMRRVDGLPSTRSTPVRTATT